MSHETLVDFAFLAGFFAFLIALVVSIVWRFFSREKHCCDESMRDQSVMREMGVSVFGDVLERCDSCGCVTVYIVKDGGSSIDKVVLTKSKWESLYASISPEDVHRAKRITGRSGESGGEEAEREEAAGIG